MTECDDVRNPRGDNLTANIGFHEELVRPHQFRNEVARDV